ncbi:hypothetical protein AYO44_13325 [Planctomycetaceae bacterium SCGC AG-212-F19]|nr:hypothetical protein AYO44_13325 [Planctomycetaceae bacterium SCGC AG-212-F19]
MATANVTPPLPPPAPAPLPPPSQREYYAEHYARLDEKLRCLRSQVQLVASGHHLGLIIHGRPGVGKTYTARGMLETLQVPFQVLTTRVSGPGLYDALTAQPDAIALIDDGGPVLEDRDAWWLLKHVLDSPSRDQIHRERLLPWHTRSRTRQGEVRQPMPFRGGVIVTCNKLPPRNPDVEAVLNRARVCELNPTEAELRALMVELAWQEGGFVLGEQVLSPQQCMEVLEYLFINAHLKATPLDMRDYNHAMETRLGCQHTQVPASWQELVRNQLSQTVPTPTSSEREAQLQKRVRTYWELQADDSFPTQTNKRAEWCRREGLGDQSYFQTRKSALEHGTALSPTAPAPAPTAAPIPPDVEPPVGAAVVVEPPGPEPESPAAPIVLAEAPSPATAASAAPEPELEPPAPLPAPPEGEAAALPPTTDGKSPGRKRLSASRFFECLETANNNAV